MRGIHTVILQFGYSQTQKMREVSKGGRRSLLALGYPIWASSISVGIGYPKGNSVALGRGIQRGGVHLGTRFSAGKSSVLYLCFRLTRERGFLRHLLYGQIAVGRHFSAAVGQADFVTWVTAQMQGF